jgi:hypothetical protein
MATTIEAINAAKGWKPIQASALVLHNIFHEPLEHVMPCEDDALYQDVDVKEPLDSPAGGCIICMMKFWMPTQEDYIKRGVEIGGGIQVRPGEGRFRVSKHGSVMPKSCLAGFGVEMRSNGYKSASYFVCDVNVGRVPMGCE